MSAIDGVFQVGDVVQAALRKSGVSGLGMSPYPNGADELDAQNDLSYMLAEWNTETWLVWHKLDLGFVSDGRAGPGLGGAYTVGPTGNFPLTPRPDRIEAAYLRILANTNIAGSGQPVDQPLVEIPSREQYSRIALKQLVAFPKAYFYDTDMGGAATPISGPNPVAGGTGGNLIIYPWPQAGLYEVHIIVKDVFPLILPMNMDLSFLPANCRAAMIFNLALRLRQAYGKGLRPDPELKALAKASLAKMRQSMVQVPELVMPGMVLGRGSLYNIYGDIYY